jgi:hypothetical protein
MVSGAVIAVVAVLAALALLVLLHYAFKWGAIGRSGLKLPRLVRTQEDVEAGLASPVSLPRHGSRSKIVSLIFWRAVMMSADR